MKNKKKKGFSFVIITRTVELAGQGEGGFLE
jgi:hypothetical protein